MSLLNWLDHLDRSIFRLVQHGTSPFLDWLMPWLRYPAIWIPLYAFMFYYAFRAGKARGEWKITLLFIILSVITVALTDSLAAQLMKPLFGRPRPCHDPEMQALLRNLVSCGGLYSMPSNHAANHFGLAAFWYFSIRSINSSTFPAQRLYSSTAHRRNWGWLWLWAALICYAQVYVGKHYPFDIVVGAVFGTLVGWGMALLFIRWRSKPDRLRGGSSS